MTSASAQAKRRWPIRWSATVLLMFAAQLALVVWLGQKEMRLPVPVTSGPVLQLAGQNSREFLALADPTLFALPHREGFSGHAWLSVTNREIRPFAWTEAPEFLEWHPDQLTKALAAPADSRGFERAAQSSDFAPELLLTVPNERQSFPARSTFVQTGGLEGRPVKTVLQLPSWPHAEVLSNSVVQLVVDAEGTALSAVLIGAGCGLKQADDYAVRQAAAVRFAPLARNPDDTSPLAGLAWGELVFYWHTLPATNAPSPKP